MAPKETSRQVRKQLAAKATDTSIPVFLGLLPCDRDKMAAKQTRRQFRKQLAAKATDTSIPVGKWQIIINLYLNIPSIIWYRFYVAITYIWKNTIVLVNPPPVQWFTK